jgi:hypothetical protein
VKRSSLPPDEPSQTTITRDEFQDLYFWLGEEAERVGFTPWRTVAWLGHAGHGRGPVSEETRLAMVKGQRRRRDREGPGERSNQDAGLSGDQPNEA